MKNSNFFPFERNKYFYGKLLSVDDFEMEQKYVNDKRRMINRFLFGAGVVSGLHVVRLDEQTISVEAGFALDSWGREMVVDVPVTKKLSQLDGYEGGRLEDSRYAYLCMEYDEREADPVHNVAGRAPSGQEQGSSSFNKIEEGYRLYLTDQEPEGEFLSPEDWYQISQNIYCQGDIRITQIMPRFIRAGSVSEMIVRVENLGRSNVSFSYELVLNYLLSEGKARVQVSFDEILFERTGLYEVAYPIQAADTVLEQGTAVIDPDSVSLRLSGVEQEVHMEGKVVVDIVGEDEKEAMQREYYRNSMERIARNGYRQALYLARLDLVSATEAYIIERVENVPFRQYVSSHVTGTALHQMMQRDLQRALQGWSDAGDLEKGSPGDRRGVVRVSQGRSDIPLEDGGKRGDKFFSREIVHGLGLGRVRIILGLGKDSGKVVYGSSEIFENGEEKGVDAELAACVNEENGSFAIGIRLTSAAEGGVVRVHWMALRDEEDVLGEKSEQRIYIRPNLLELKIRESYDLEAVCENMVDKAVSWSVRDGGGFIDGTGMYTAPNTPGVYEVTAQSVAFPEVRASIFVVVRELD